MASNVHVYCMNVSEIGPSIACTRIEVENLLGGVSISDTTHFVPEVIYARFCYCLLSHILIRHHAPSNSIHNASRGEDEINIIFHSLMLTPELRSKAGKNRKIDPASKADFPR